MPNTCGAPPPACDSHGESVGGRGFGIAALDGPAPSSSRALARRRFFTERRRRRAARRLSALPRRRADRTGRRSACLTARHCALMNEEGMVEVDRGNLLDRAVPLPPAIACSRRADADDRAGPRRRPAADPVVGLARRRPSRPHDRVRAPRRRTPHALPPLPRHERRRDTPQRAPPLRARSGPFQVTPPWQAFGELGGVEPDPRRCDGGAQGVPGRRAPVVVPLDARGRLRRRDLRSG